MAEITWINHAGYELEIDGLRIVHDPWIEGLAFGNGWSLLSKANYPVERFASVDYIWFSHEHPDHFSPALLKSIPAADRSRIKVLFQETRDKRVKTFCEKLGFTVIELPHEKQIFLSQTVSIRCGAVLGRDSWLFIQGAASSIFNANDCVGVDWKRVKELVAAPVDVLLTQFSYANWVGNPGEHERMRAAAARKITEIREQLDAFAPAAMIPFASFVWFCRDDNFHMNEHVNTISRIEQLFRDDWNVVVLYPGDRHVIGEPHDNRTAIEQYERDRASHGAPLTVDEKSVSVEALLALSSEENKRLRANNALALLKPLAWAGYLPSASLYLRDIGEGLSYSMFRGIFARGISREQCDIECTSESFAGMMRNGYGYGTLAVNGRYSELRPGGMARVSKNFAVSARNEEGETVPGIFLKKEYVLAHLPRFMKIGRARAT